MRVTWVLSEEILEGTLDMDIVKAVCPSWGSWKVWKEHKVDNCVCSHTGEAGNLIKRALHAVCNLYIPQDAYTKLGNPLGVKLFDGAFASKTVGNKDDIVALNLATPNNDIVLMSGFNFTPMYSTDVAREEYYFNVRALINSHPDTQFVLVDYDGELASWAKELDNLSVDTIDSVKSLLV